MGGIFFEINPAMDVKCSLNLFAIILLSVIRIPLTLIERKSEFFCEVFLIANLRVFQVSFAFLLCFRN